MSASPLVSVITPVHNTEAYLPASIQSVLNQSLSNFEYIIIDDASTDRSWQIIQDFAQQDDRIKPVRNPQKQSLAQVRNQALEMAQGKYIAKIDADDINEPQRLQMQVSYLEKTPEVILCGAGVQYFSEDQMLATWWLNVNPMEIKCRLLFENCFANSTIMMRKSVIDQHHIRYQSDFDFSEDYGFWSAMSQQGNLAVIPEILAKVRQHTQKVSVKFTQIQRANAEKVQRLALQELNISPTPEELRLHFDSVHGSASPDLNLLKSLSQWLLKLQGQNQAKKIYPEPEFTHLLKQIWTKHTAGQTHLGPAFFKIIQQNPLSSYHSWSAYQQVKFKAKCLLKR
ncbi:MAG TPA: hypothetical protein DCS93_02820 [Microscillaceae bacterium]|nr:hypothetical protein [Microscillaceae bacterium]